MQEGGVEAHAMIDHQQISLQREGMVRRQDYHAIGGSKDDRTLRLGDIDT